MQTLTRIADVRAAVARERAAGRRIAFVPTMGALHDGHLQLVARAREHADVVVMSIFVNPLQFGPGEDLARYPRDLEADRKLCAAAGVDVVFAPNVVDQYSTEVTAPCGIFASHAWNAPSASTPPQLSNTITAWAPASICAFR